MHDLKDTPDLFAPPPTPIAVQPLRILALDLGTLCGWASISAHGVRSGSRDLGGNPLSHPGQRFENWRAFLAERFQQDQPTQVAYEVVMGHGDKNPILAAHLYGAWEGMLHWYCARQRVPVTQLHVGTIKKNWTGDGRAKKEMMMIEARRRGYRPGNDNEADALAILHLAMAIEDGRHE